MLHVTQARVPPPSSWCSRPDPAAVSSAARTAAVLSGEYFARSAALRPAIVRQQLFFPDRRLLQFDCGKLQVDTMHCHLVWACLCSVNYTSSSQSCSVAP